MGVYQTIQIHGQLPPPLVWYGPPLALIPSAFGEDQTGCNVQSDRLPSNGDIFGPLVRVVTAWELAELIRPLVFRLIN